MTKLGDIPVLGKISVSLTVRVSRVEGTEAHTFSTLVSSEKELIDFIKSIGLTDDKEPF